MLPQWPHHTYMPPVGWPLAPQDFNDYYNAQLEGTHEKTNIDAGITRENIWQLSRDTKHCRTVQEHLKANKNAIQNIVAGLHTHVWEALHCPNANHVLQTIISEARKDEYIFILDEILALHDGIILASEHRFGCRIVQALMKDLYAADQKKIQPVFDALIDNAVQLSKGRFGTFVIDGMLKCKLEEGVNKLFETLKGQAKDIVSDDNGALVLCTALGDDNDNFSAADKESLAREILKSIDICQMAKTRHGNVAIRHAIDKVHRNEQEFPIAKLLEDRESISSHRYGRLVIQFAESRSKEWMQEVSA
jgi:pumilio RNA-binding family